MSNDLFSKLVKARLLDAILHIRSFTAKLTCRKCQSTSEFAVLKLFPDDDAKIEDPFNQLTCAKCDALLFQQSYSKTNPVITLKDKICINSVEMHNRNAHDKIIHKVVHAEILQRGFQIYPIPDWEQEE